MSSWSSRQDRPRQPETPQKHPMTTRSNAKSKQGRVEIDTASQHSSSLRSSSNPAQIVASSWSQSHTLSNRRRMFQPSEMPGLTVDSSPSPQSLSQTLDSQITSSSSASPTHDAPPYSPITPTLAAARLAQQQQPTQTYTYTHTQEAQTSIPQPPPVAIAFEENPDALALKSAISILQMQARNAAKDIVTLQRFKERAVNDPEGFRAALAQGKVKGGNDGLFDEEDSDEEEDGDGDVRMEEEVGSWGRLPTPQKVVRCPPVNWNQYAVVGESLDRLHRDQVARPTEGMPQRLGPDGQLFFGGEGARRQSDMGVAAPYTPGKDRIEKMGTRKGGKR